MGVEGSEGEEKKSQKRVVMDQRGQVERQKTGVRDQRGWKKCPKRVVRD